jgi:hypothetical protein
VVATPLCVRQPQLRYSSEASLLQMLQLLCELLYHLLLLQLFLQLLLQEQQVLNHLLLLLQSSCS